MDEKIIELNLLKEVNEKEHQHEELEFIYVVEGNYTVTYEAEKYTLGKEDMVLINKGREHSVVSFGENCLVCRLCFSYYSIVKQTGEKFILFMCNSTQEKDYRYAELRNLLKDLLIEYSGGGKKNFYTLTGLEYLVLGYLLKHFKLSSVSIEDSSGFDLDTKLAYIRTYIHDHYMDRAIVTKLAEELFVSASSLSRYYKKATGESITQYLQKSRVKKIEEQLILKNTSITQIALESGFSTAAAMNKLFKQYTGMTPGEYRRRNRGAEQKPEKDESLINKLRLKEVLSEDIEKNKWKGVTETARIDVKQERQAVKKKVRFITAGKAALLKNANMQKQILQMQKELGIQYIRIWNVFSKQLISTAEQNQYYFHEMDSILDFCVENGLKLFLNMGNRSRGPLLNEVTKEEEIREEISFKSEKDWIHFLECFFSHICRRYGEAVVSSWIIEFSFFLDTKPYYPSMHYSSRQVWKLGHSIVKKYIPGGRIAAPGVYMEMGTELMKDLLDAFWKTECIPELFTFCSSPLNTSEKNIQLQNMNHSVRFSEQIEDIKKELGRRGFQGEYCMTAWKDIPIDRNYVQDSCYRGSTMLKNILENYDRIDSMGSWYASDLSYDISSSGLLCGSSGLLSRDGVCKPAWYALQFLNRMGDYKIAQGGHYYTTADRDGRIYILCYNSTSYFAGYEYSENEEAGGAPKLFRMESELNLELDIRNLTEPGHYTIQEEIVNDEIGNVLYEWKRLGFEKNLSHEDIEYLKKVCTPQRKKTYVHVQEDQLILNVVMAANEMRLITIEHEGDRII